MKTIVSEKGQITIPKELRDRFGLKPGTEIKFEVLDGAITMLKSIGEDSIIKWRGQGKLKIGTDDYLRQIRDEDSD